MNVNEIIMNKRIERGVSRKELAEGLGVSESTIYRIETNPNLNPNNKLVKIIYVFLTIFLYLLKCPQSLILSALRAFFFCGKPHISRSIFLYFPYQSWLKSW